MLLILELFLVFLFSSADEEYEEVVILENNNLNKTEDVISGLFVVNSLLQNEVKKDEELVDLVDTTIHEEVNEEDNSSSEDEDLVFSSLSEDQIDLPLKKVKSSRVFLILIFLCSML